MYIKYIFWFNLIAIISCRKINLSGLEIIKSYEGFHSHFYQDIYGVKAIGFGHRCLKDNCNDIQEPISQELAETLLKSDLIPYEECVEHYAPALNDDQYSALVSFTWTMGCGTLRTSNLLHHIKAQSFMEASNEFIKFTVSRTGGEGHKDLNKRRKVEKELFCRSGGCTTH